MTESLARVAGLLLIVVAGVEAFLVARGIGRWVIAQQRIAEWSGRPEVENWADPYFGADWLPAAFAAGLIVLVVGGATLLIAARLTRAAP